jgi:hypothetical protein
MFDIFFLLLDCLDRIFSWKRESKSAAHRDEGREWNVSKKSGTSVNLSKSGKFVRDPGSYDDISVSEPGKS